MSADTKMDKVASLLARRGFLFQSGEIYSALAGFFDFGHYGTLLKRNIEASWWDTFVTKQENIVGMDGSIISSSQIWNASGHLKEFTDPLVECGKCKTKFRADQLISDELHLSVDGLSLEKINSLLNEHKLKCEKCEGELEVAKPFNLMFKTNVGAVEEENSEAYLRPETAQLIFTNFKQLQLSSRKQLPFGIAQIGKAFRNEISPRNLLFRCREFSQMEIEYFINPAKMQECDLLAKEDLSLEINVLTAAMQEKKTDGRKFKFKELVDKKVIGNKWHAYLILLSYDWFLKLGIKKENLRIREHLKEELSHYSQETWDLEYNYPWGWKELAGIANRTDYDLKQHMLGSKKDLSYFDEATKSKVIPFVIEPSFGLERAWLTVLLDAYEEKTEKEERKTVLHFNPSISPVAVAVFPLMKKDGLAEKAKQVFAQLKEHFPAEYDESGSIGRRYARQDEIGTPFCITIDYDTLKDESVTIRDRDTTGQKRINIMECVKYLEGALRGRVR